MSAKLKTKTPSDLGTFTGLTPAKLTNLDQNDIASPSVNPGKKGRGVRREYTMVETLEVMVATHFRDWFGIVNRRQLGPIVRAISAIPGFDYRLSSGRGVLDGDGEFPRYVVFNGKEAYTTDEFPVEPACMVVDLAEFVCRLSWLDGTLSTFDPGLRLETLWFIGQREYDDDGALERAAKRLASEIVDGVIPLERAARALDVSPALLKTCIADIRRKEAEAA